MTDAQSQRVLMIGGVYSTPLKLREYLAKHGAAVDFHYLDELSASDPETAQASLDALTAFDALVLGPAWREFRTFLDTPSHEWHRAIELNFERATYIMQAAARKLIEHGRGGRIILMLPVMAEVPFSHSSAYGTTSAMLYALGRMAAVDLAPHGITVNAVALGWMHDEYLSALPAEYREQIKSGIPRSTPTSWSEAGAVVQFLLSPASSGMTGAWLAVDSGYSLTRSPGSSMFVR